MEDGKCTINTSSVLDNLHRDIKFTTNGHDAPSQPSSPTREPPHVFTDALPYEPQKKRVNPLKIHLGKRPFVDNSSQYYTSNKKKPKLGNKLTEPLPLPNVAPRAPKLIPKKKVNKSQFQNVTSYMQYLPEDEQDKPVPRLVPKSQLTQFKKNATERGAQIGEHLPSPGLQPAVKFKCRRCCAMSFKTLAMLKEHQLVCRAQTKEPIKKPEPAPSTDAISGGPSRVTRKVYLCSACGTYYENWNLFLHMREVHNRHICLFCLGMFSKADKLSTHLMNKHNVKEFNYESKEDFFDVYSGNLYLMCCECEEICSEKDDIFNHDCSRVIPKPVPVLVSKNASKINNLKQNRNSCELPSNKPFSSGKESKSISSVQCDDKTIDDTKLSIHNPTFPNVSQLQSNEEQRLSNSSFNSDIILENVNKKEICNNNVEKILNCTDQQTNAMQQTPVNTENKRLPNGDDSSQNSSACESIDSEVHTPNISQKYEENAPHPPERGIKLKLSLNKANSPVIINSTVDPSIGLHKLNKPPTRARRPPKRYEKEPSIDQDTLYPRTPTIKMTICDADKPFVKTMVCDGIDDTRSKTLINNNLESLLSKPFPQKSESTVLSTIYDNKLEDQFNTLNRVPKLTVRVPKELLDKDSSTDYSSDSDSCEKLTVDENKNDDSKLDESTNNLPRDETMPDHEQELLTTSSQSHALTESPPDLLTTPQPIKDLTDNYENEVPLQEIKPETDTATEDEPNIEGSESQIDVEKVTEEPPVDEIPILELKLDRPLDKYSPKELLKVFLSTTIYNCIYCNHVRKIAINGEKLSLHMASEHRFSATVDSITAEELMPETIAAKVKEDARELQTVYFNLDSYDSELKCEDVEYDRLFECFQCYFKTSIHKDLYLHNRKMHQKTILLCVMCKSNFYSYSELLCHMCPGAYDTEYEIKYRCCLCKVDTIPSSFRLMVHLRKIHNACDVCLEFCHNQSKLSNHVWKHKLHHLCYRCGIAYRNKPDITKHLFWKHGTESVLCKRCLQKKWPHVYHFCTPPAVFICDECNLQFTKAVYLKVHKRFHSNEFPHNCTEPECTEKFVSKKILMKHLEEHQRKLATVDLEEKSKKVDLTDKSLEPAKEPIAIIDLVDDKHAEVGDKDVTAVKSDSQSEQQSKKSKKKKQKEKDALLLDVNLPELNLSESDSSDESDSEAPVPPKEENKDVKPDLSEDVKSDLCEDLAPKLEAKSILTNEDIKPDKIEPVKEEDPIEPLDIKADEQKVVLDIWDNFQKYQAKVEKPKEKTPPLVPIRKHVCDSDHDYCLIPVDLNGDQFNSDKKKKKKDRKSGELSSSSSSSSSDSDSSCSCGSNCSCSSSSGSSSSSSSDSDSSDEPNRIKKKKIRKSLPNRRLSNGSNVDVMGMSETPVLIPEKTEPPIAETDLDTEESETDEEFYDQHPQRLANKLYAEKRNQLMLLASVAPSDGGSVSGDASRPITPIKKEVQKEKPKEKSSSKKKSKKKKRSKSSKKNAPLKIHIPKEIIAQPDKPILPPPLPIPNKITISLQSNTVQIPEPPKQAAPPSALGTPLTSAENKRASKRRRVPNKFYGYSSDEEGAGTPSQIAFKPQQPPKLEWRKEDLPSPVTHKPKKELPTPSSFTSKLYNYVEPIRLKTPIPDPELPKILMNTESMDSSDSDSSDEGALEIHQPNSAYSSDPLPPPTYLNSGTSSLPYAFQRPACRQAREGESVYCYCRCPYDEVSEMIACDADGCAIEWFHFECVGIMVPPKGKWYCPECRKKQGYSGYR